MREFANILPVIINFIPPTLYMIAVIIMVYFTVVPYKKSPEERKPSKGLLWLLNSIITLFSAAYLIMVLLLAYNNFVASASFSISIMVTGRPSLVADVLPFFAHLGAAIYYFTAKQSWMKAISSIGAVCTGILLLYLILQ